MPVTPLVPLLVLTASPALAGYGDVVDGRPSWDQRELLTLTNLVRVAPEAWSYPCNMNQWSASERTPKTPLAFHDGLTEIAQLHSEDMSRHGFMDHDSWDGTDFGDRVWPYYEGRTIGENVAWGYADNEAAVFDGWMCSSGHRSNIMEASFEDMGGGVKGEYYTQDFGGGAGTPHVPVAMGVHQPEVPTRTVTWTATWSDDAPPAQLSVETDDACVELARTVGTDSLGAWQASQDAASGCTTYRFFWITADGDTGSLPANGGYQAGQGCPAWTDQAPLACQPEPDPEPAPDPDDSDSGTDDGAPGEPGDCPPTPDDRNGDCTQDGSGGAASGSEGATGCSSTPALGGLWLALAALARRRERSPPA